MLSTRVLGSLSFKASSTMASIATLKRISADQLSQKMLAERDATEPSFAIVDVRDDGKLAIEHFHLHALSGTDKYIAIRLYRWPHQGVYTRSHASDGRDDAIPPTPPSRQEDSCIPLRAKPAKRS